MVRLVRLVRVILICWNSWGRACYLRVLTGRGAGLGKIEPVVPFFCFDLLAPCGFVPGPLPPVLCMLHLRVVGSGVPPASEVLENNARAAGGLLRCFVR